MSLLMQALRKAERARAHNGGDHPEDHQFGQDSVPSPPPIEGGPAFAVMPDAWRLEPLDAEPPVVAAQEAAHDPVPPQARHEPSSAAPPRTGTPAPAHGGYSTGSMHPAGGAIGSDAGSAPNPSPEAPGRGAGPRDPGATDAGVRDQGFRSPGVRNPGARPSSPARAIASSQRRLVLLAGTLAAMLAVFAFIYWRAVSGPGPGSRLPMVPMPAPGALPAAQTGTQQTAAIPVTPYISAPGGEAAAPAAATAPAGTPAGAAIAAGAPALDPSPPPAPTPSISAAATPRTGAAPPSKPRTEVAIPTPEQLAAISDPAIRAEAMRDAAERAARQVRMEGASPAPGTVAGAEPVPATAPPLAVTADAPGASGIRRSRPRQPAAAPAAASPAAAARTLPTAVGENGDVRFVRSADSLQVEPAVQHGYAALQGGDLGAARQQYDLALLQDPNNRDALLGSAAVALREHDGKQASANYLRLLELDPNDPEALAGLAELHPGDLQASEVRLRGLARQHPESGPVQFALGNLYARQGRWPEAQQSYFRAFTAMPGNADYAFNLGVGLDRMNQPRLATTYYRRALELAQASPPGFNIDAVRKRLQALETPAQ